MPRSCDPFRQTHKTFIAETLLDEYSDVSDENLFLCIGKITPWSDSDNRINSVDSVKDNTDFWRSLIAAKRINRSDTSLVVRRIDWQPGVIYDSYRDNIDLFDDVSPAKFYALVDEERVYVCIDNNNNSRSLNAPTHSDSTIRKLADGYKWKFLYQIPESKRKFLTKSDSNTIGYMPVEYVEYLKTNDDRGLQWTVQQAAVNGKIEHAYLDSPAKIFWITTQSCVLPSENNVVVNTIAPGLTQIQIYSTDLAPSDIYSNMIFSVESGGGQGQRRIVKKYTWNPISSNATIEVDPLVIGLSGSDAITPESQSKWSFTPRVIVKGDGFGNNSNNPNITTADFTLKFGTDLTGASADCANYGARLISSIEVVDGGRDYTFADLSVPKGITSLNYTPNEYKDFSSLIHAVMPPPGGHGANPVKELGSAALMIVKNFDRDEEGKLDTNNDFRQFGVIRNPLLREKRYRIKFFQPGLSGTFTAGGTAQQVTTPLYGVPVGKVLEWCKGHTGVSGTSELIIDEVVGGTFVAGGTMSGLTIFDVKPIIVAGDDGRRLLDLTMKTQDAEFSSSGTSYLRNYFSHGVGNKTLNVHQSRSTGQIFRWSVDSGTLQYGTLSLEYPRGKFNINETVLQTEPIFYTTNGYSGPGKITAISTSVEGIPSSYDLTTSVVLGGDELDNESFALDSQVYFAQGSTVGNGFIIDWSPSTGNTSGILRLSGVQGNIVVGQSVDYIVLGSGATTTIVADIDSISHRGELKYASGEVLYIQNINAISRDLEQREEVKLVIEL